MFHYQNIWLHSVSANFCIHRYKTSLACSFAENVNVLSINVRLAAVLNENSSSFFPFAFESLLGVWGKYMRLELGSWQFVLDLSCAEHDGNSL